LKQQYKITAENLLKKQKILFKQREPLLNHSGPLILAGDFDNWSDGRSAIIVKLINRLSLQAVSFDGERRVKFLGEPVDHILYRGLKPLNREVHLVKSSDHNPISVSFRLVDLKNE